MVRHLPVEVDPFCVVVVIRVDRAAHPLGDVEIWVLNLGKPSLYLIRVEYSRKSKRSTNVIKLGDLSVQEVEIPL